MSQMPASSVRVWQGTLQIPTYTEGPANPNPPFDLFSFGRFNYPYPIRDALTDRRESIAWRTLNLENEYLQLTVLPDLGGHIYRCLDKRTGREMFYANTAIKKALIGYRGAWAAFGVEFNFPVSHNWMSMSPVDFATMQHPDGSGSIWVGNVDQVYGAQWRVELRLDPGRSVLEQKVDLYNAERGATSLLLVEQRGRAGLGRFTSRVSDRTDGNAWVHADRTMARRQPGPRPERNSEPGRWAGLAFHLWHTRGIRRSLSSAHSEWHRARRRTIGTSHA